MLWSRLDDEMFDVSRMDYPRGWGELAEENELQFQLSEAEAENELQFQQAQEEYSQEYKEKLEREAEEAAAELEEFVIEDPEQFLTFVAAPDACPICEDQDGLRFTAAEWDDEEYWKPHPNCNCELEPD